MNNTRYIVEQIKEVTINASTWGGWRNKIVKDAREKVQFARDNAIKNIVHEHPLSLVDLVTVIGTCFLIVVALIKLVFKIKKCVERRRQDTEPAVHEYEQVHYENCQGTGRVTLVNSQK